MADDPLCSNCSHPKSVHAKGAYECRYGISGRGCECTKFIRPGPRSDPPDPFGPTVERFELPSISGMSITEFRTFRARRES